MVTTGSAGASFQVSRVLGNKLLCKEHYCLTLALDNFPDVRPGQFVHLSPEPSFSAAYYLHEGYPYAPRDAWKQLVTAPLLRRAFSVAAVRRDLGSVAIDVMYRVVGTATRWMESLCANEAVSVHGPLGNGFPISPDKRVAWMVAGGVGLPPMLLLASTLQQAGVKCVAFCGSRSADLLPLSLDSSEALSRDAARASLCCPEFARYDVPLVVSTDDGSVGFPGHVGQAMQAYSEANPHVPSDVVVYTCGPERMMQHVANLCSQWRVDCFACVERAMACGTGLCQSCVVGERDSSDPEGWKYKLCCTDGPVFEADRICW